MHTFVLVAGVALGLAQAAAAATLAVPTLTVDASVIDHAISPYIYGLSAGPGIGPPEKKFASKIQLPLIRWGGDGTSKYNWQQDTTNSGYDFFFMGGKGGATPVPSGQVDTIVMAYPYAMPLITIPIIPYVARDTINRCSFPVSIYGHQQREFSDFLHGDSCGNSISTTGQQLIDTNLTSNYIANSTALQSTWVEHLVKKYHRCAYGGVCFYQLDNEPNGWSNTHRDVVPTPKSYSFITALGEAYATAIKDTDPTAKVFGPSDYLFWGWTANSPTSEPSVIYYLKQFSAYDSINGRRSLDYLDEHGRVGDNIGSIQQDFDSVRWYWDPTFNFRNEIFDGPIQFIPRMIGYINTYYPGTQLALSEYEIARYPGEPVIDALVLADALGVFGYYNLQVAALFDRVGADDTVAKSFLLYRNYDGIGGKFGEQSVRSNSTDPTRLSIYGAIRSSDRRLTVIVINKESVPYTTAIVVSGFQPELTAECYTYSKTKPNAIVPEEKVSVSDNTITYTFAPYSATEFILAPRS